jgi:hypothetical protein
MHRLFVGATDPDSTAEGLAEEFDLTRMIIQGHKAWKQIEAGRYAAFYSELETVLEP